MDSFIEYIKNAKQLIENINSSSGTLVHIVMGNESCDLDSMIAALALAYFIHCQYARKQSQTTVVPLLNIHADEFILRTENCYVLEKRGISSDSLVFRNNINLLELQTEGLLSTSLVDHHVVQKEDRFLEPSVIEIYDHRPVDPNACWSKDKVQVTIEPVGCCSTLVAHKILTEDPSVLNETLAALLYDVITFDTIAFKPEAGKVKELDVKTATELVKRFSLMEDATVLFNELWKAHNDVSHLSAKQLLSKDLKVVEGLLIPGLPMLVKDYFKLPNALQDMTDFCKEKGSSTMVLIGLHVVEAGTSTEVHRDIAVFTFSNGGKLTDAIVANLKKAEDIKGYNFCLEEKAVDMPNTIYFSQGNIKLTRKHILPIIKETIAHHIVPIS